MTENLRLAEFLLTAALAFVLIALICNLVIITSRKAVARAAPAKALVTVGGREVTADEAGPPSRAADGGARAPAKRGRLATIATGFTIVALVLLTVYLGVRIAITGHGPFANQHEFAVSFVWGILLAYVIVERIYKVRMISVVVLPVAACLMLYALAKGAEFESLVPALQNNLLLTLHVGFAVLAYGAACVSFGAAVLFLLQPRLKGRGPRPELLDEIGYKAAVVAFPLMTIFIVLGAIWADTAWGRPWGWDPKETAALVMWLVYAAFLHARVVRNWRGKKAAWLLVAGFATVLFAYFGNEFLGGLHSYG